MVELAPKKRRRLDSTTTTTTPSYASARYPPSCLLSNLIHRQAPHQLSSSIQSVVVTTPPKPATPAIHAFTGDHYALDLVSKSTTLLNKSPIRLAEQFHDQCLITHLVWNQRGTTLASADENGKIALWELGTSSDQWTLAYSVNLQQPPAGILWLNTDRVYQLSHDQQKFVRMPMVGPRNPYGYFAFVVVTVHGQVSVHYQRGGKIFSSFSTTLPNTGRMGAGRADVGCFGMNLASSDNWYRISHASMIIGQDGNIYLATHRANTSPKSVQIYRLSIRFPGRMNEGGIFCQPLATLRLTQPSLASSLGDFAKSSSIAVSHLQLSNQKDNVQLTLAFGAENDGSYSSFIGKWALQQKEIQISGDAIARDSFSGTTMTSNYLVLDFVDGVSVSDRFISSMTHTRHGALVVGLSDGSVHIEYRDDGDFGLLRGRGSCESSIGPTFWQAAGPRTYLNGDPDPVAGLALSPNETHIFCILSSNKLGVIRATDIRNDHDETETLSTISRLLKLSLLNETDDLDLISELIRVNAISGHDDATESLVLDVIKSYHVYCHQDQSEPLLVSPTTESSSKSSGSLEWSLPQRGRAYGLSLGVFRLSSTKVQYTNLCKAIQLPIVLECFIGSCKSDYADITKVLDSNTIVDGKATLEFDTDSLWSLMSLTNWTLDFMRWTLRKWNMLFNCRRPKDSKLGDISARPCHAVLLLHEESRDALSKLLVMVNEFVHYTNSASFELPNVPESLPLLLRYAKNVLSSEPVALKDVLAFLTAIKSEDLGVQDRWALLLGSKLPSDKVDRLRVITREFAEKCGQPAIYLERDSSDIIDVIQKRRIPPFTKHLWTCVRCHQYSIPTHGHPHLTANDPCLRALWNRSIGRRCVCGGLFAECL
ncbi:hypothetical protein RO3G_03953 [Lichtheimia corymbifera JMRC:FSU:9682]|uniref:Mediator of RNA polymerase II transcription subunit 16 n=1 Tax=Lichtheimia corymbifera JMRC:FSU:9682 TaxID=1263082 RepID=A0A068S0N9_9FUNG|nr:hypothetical protein RO3G_03953 [Lichtheimia corymbifera JMRC:FSU:9682]